ncbi:hypothetical protein [Thermomonospora amylolytica]|nr:hypothetical protein [Thermomonospora amylolytica]
MARVRGRVVVGSDESACISGAEIPVDGGRTAHRGAKSISDALRQEQVGR